MKQVPAFKTARTETAARIFSVPNELPSGKEVDTDFLDQVVSNWNEYQAKDDPRFPKPTAYLIPAPSITIGHEKNSSIAQKYAQRSDLPAVGWPDELRRDGNYLTAIFRGVPEKLAAWIESGAYSKISAEFYPNYRGLGPCLRRVSILGASIPDCKDLGDIPTFVYEESEESDHNPLVFSESMEKASASHKRFAIPSPDGYSVVTFAEENPNDIPRTQERKPMTPQQQALMTALQAAGIDCSKMDSSTLDAIIAAAAPVPKTDAVVERAEDETTGAEKKMTEDDVATYAEKIIAKALEGYQKQFEQVTNAAKVAAAAARLTQDKSEIATFCEKNKLKFFPYERNPKVGVTMEAQLLALPNDAVAKYGEGETAVELTPRQAMMKSIENRPDVACYSEQLPDDLNSPSVKADVERALSYDFVGKAALKEMKKQAMTV